jgi:prolyl-tRNA synthetase
MLHSQGMIVFWNGYTTVNNYGPVADETQPASYFIWEEIQNWFNAEIKKVGVKNCSFPLFVSEDVLQREKDHIEGFAAEVAWVTHAYDSPFDQRCMSLLYD